MNVGNMGEFFSTLMFNSWLDFVENNPGVIFLTTTPDRGETAIVNLVKAYDQISSIISFYVFQHVSLVILHLSDGMIYFVVDGANSLRQEHVYDDVPESSTHRRATFHPPMPPPSPPTSPVSLEQLLVPLNVIVQRLAAINERQAGHSKQHQQPPESSYLNFLAAHPTKFVETTDPLETNHWLRVTESKFGLLHCSKLQKTLFVAQQLHGSASAWWATYTATLQDNHQVSWNEFCKVFCECHISAGILRRKL
jgi:hypothetical protein